MRDEKVKISVNNPSYDCEKSLSGGGWHEVQIVRRGKSVTLVVDKIENTADIPGGSGSGFLMFQVIFTLYQVNLRTILR